MKIPYQSITIIEVIDTSIFKIFVEDSIIIERLLPARGSYNLVEVMCDTDVDSIVISNIQMILIDEGFNIPHGITGVYSPSTRRALISFQKENRLPVGNFNIETMKLLGIY